MILCACVISPGSSTAARSASTSGQIAFGTFGSKPGIFVVNGDGTRLRRLTGGRDEDPAWSPDGRRIAFVRNIRIGWDRDEPVLRSALFAVDSDGTRLVRLSPSGTHDENPTWSPDGRTIAFERGDRLGTDVWVMNPDGTRVRPLTRSRVLSRNPRGRPTEPALHSTDRGRARSRSSSSAPMARARGGSHGVNWRVSARFGRPQASTSPSTVSATRGSTR